MKFIDSFQFTPKSLDVLSKTLEDDEFRYLIESCTTSHCELVQRKGVYPYDYMDSFDRFDVTSLPSRDSFFNKLSGSPCSDSEYAHATRVWEAFGCQAIADIYLQLDVLKYLFRILQSRSTALLHYTRSCMGCCTLYVTC